MGEIVSTVSQLTALLDKAGTIGVLVFVVVAGGWYIKTLRKELARQYQLRNKYQLGFALCKQKLDDSNIKVDLSQVSDLLEENGKLT